MIERAVITRVDGTSGRVWFTIDRLTGPDVEHGGPNGADVYVHAGAVDAPITDTTATTTSTGGGSGDDAFAAHTHDVTLRPLGQGDTILVASIAGSADDWVVFARRAT